MRPKPIPTPSRSETDMFRNRPGRRSIRAAASVCARSPLASEQTESPRFSRRLHSTLGYLSPMNFEKAWAVEKKQLAGSDRNVA